MNTRAPHTTNTDPPRSLTSEDVLLRKYACGDHTTSREKCTGKKFTASSMQINNKHKEHNNNKNRTGLPDHLKARLEALSGIALSHVRVHTNSSKPAEVNALAYTKGQDIYMGPGQKKHLPHEAWHAVQQSKGRVQPTLHAYGKSINDDKNLEREADAMAAKALQIGNPTIPAQTTNSNLTVKHINSSQALQRRPLHDTDTLKGIQEGTTSPANQQQGEIAIMSGGPTSNKKDPHHDKNPVNFLTTARVRIEKYIQNAFASQSSMTARDHLTWAIMRPSYLYRAKEDGKDENAYINLVEARIPKLKAFWNKLRGHEGDSSISTGESAIAHHYIDDKADFVSFMNDGIYPGNRAQFPIKQFDYFGHGYPGRLTFLNNWQHVTGSQSTGNIRFTISDIKEIQTDAILQDARYRSWSCNTATPSDAQDGSRGQAGTQSSFAEEWVRRLGGRFVAPHGRTSYETQGEVNLGTSYYGGKPAHWLTIEARDYGVTDPPRSQKVEMPAEVAQEVISKTPGDHSEVLQELTPLQSGSIGVESTSATNIEIYPASPAPSEPTSSAPSSERRSTSPEPIASPQPTSISSPVDIELPETNIAPDTQDAAWQSVLNGIGNQVYAETVDTDSAPGSLYSLFDDVGHAVRSHSQGFRVSTGNIDGVPYYQVTGRSGSIGPGWYPVSDLRNPSTAGIEQLATKVNARTALKAGAFRKSNALLTVAGNTLDYAVDPKKEFGSDFVVDVSFDLAKASASSAVGAATGAGVTSVLAGGALGATVGSAAPVVGTIVGFVVGILAAMTIEYFISDYRGGLKSWFRSQNSDPNAPGGSGGSSTK